MIGCITPTVSSAPISARPALAYCLEKLAVTMELARIEKISKALADETRLRIFEAISTRGKMTCGDIVSMRGVTHATVSHHLKILAQAGLIESQRHGQFVSSHAIPEAIQEYTQALSQLTRGCRRPRRR